MHIFVKVIRMPISQNYYEKTHVKWLAPREHSSNFRSLTFKIFFLGTTFALSLFKNAKITFQITVLITSFLNEIITKKKYLNEEFRLLSRKNTQTCHYIFIQELAEFIHKDEMLFHKPGQHGSYQLSHHFARLDLNSKFTKLIRLLLHDHQLN